MVVTVQFLFQIVASLSSFLAPEDAGATNAPHNLLLGFVFIMLSCIVQGSQYIFEEKVLDEYEAPPLIVIGMEGLWGTIIMLFLGPLLYYTPG